MTTDKCSQKIIAVLAMALLFSVSGLAAKAQNISPASDKPPVPRLGTAPDLSAWTIQYKYKQADPYPKATNPIDQKIYDKMRAAHPRLLLVQFVKAGARRKEVQQYADGTETIRWLDGDILTTDNRVSHSLQTFTAKESDIPFKDDFYTLEWVNQAGYVGRQDHNGVTCYVYHLKKSGDTDEQTAYVDVKTNLPAEIETGEAILDFTFGSSSDTLELPKDVAARLQAFRASQVTHPG